MAGIADYEPIVGKSVIEELRLLGERLKGKVVQNINSTAVGGGVAEILNRLIPLLRELKVDARWDFIKGGERFFQITKRIHNSLHGRKEDIDDKDFAFFLANIEDNSRQINLYGDIIFIHDPQPLPLIKNKSKLPKSKWFWRCHIDLSNPQSDVWAFIRNFVEDYDAAVFSAPSFAQKLKLRQFLISPSIDPLSEKNKELPLKFIHSVLVKYGIDRKLPIILQLSRFDYLKDPFGVIDAFNLVRKYNKCQLVLAGGTAMDDPESDKVLAQVREKAGDNPYIHILALPAGSDLEVNALQRAAGVVIQKSIKEGFGLTVTEALWKAKPVVASAVGGIPLQIKHRYSGLLCHTVEGAATLIRQLLNNPDYANRLGQNGREHIKQNFLLTRHLRDYILLFLAIYQKEDVVSL